MDLLDDKVNEEVKGIVAEQVRIRTSSHEPQGIKKTPYDIPDEEKIQALLNPKVSRRPQLTRLISQEEEDMHAKELVRGRAKSEERRAKSEERKVFFFFFLEYQTLTHES